MVQRKKYSGRIYEICPKILKKPSQLVRQSKASVDSVSTLVMPEIFDREKKRNVL